MNINPPPMRPCTCAAPVVWLFSARTRRWVAFDSVDGHPRTLIVHDCTGESSDGHDWRSVKSPFELDPERAERAARGVAMVRNALREKAAMAQTALPSSQNSSRQPHGRDGRTTETALSATLTNETGSGVLGDGSDGFEVSGFVSSD